MRCERQQLSGDAATLARELRELVPAPESVSETVAEIIARVRASGDDALRYYTREFDTHGATPASLVVPDAELDTALERLDDDIRAGLELAITNVARVAEAQLVDRPYGRASTATRCACARYRWRAAPCTCRPGAHRTRAPS